MATLETYNPLTSAVRSCLNQSGGLGTRNLRLQSSAEERNTAGVISFVNKKTPQYIFELVSI
ncbi:MAG: hypothetical protein ACTS6G_01470 [Candidatus Hodgkinia cicadicola]